MRSGHRGIRVLMSDRDADGGTPEGRRFFTLDELEWPSLAKYKARLHQLGRLRSEEREMITLQTKILARSVRIAVALLMAAGSVFGALLTTTLIHPNFYFRRHVIGVVARSQECEMASLGLAPASNGPLGGLRTDLTTAFDRRSLFNELQHLWKFDTIRFNFADGPTILFYESLMARMPVSLMRVLTFGILWPEVIDIFVQPLDNCSRARLWPHAERVAAYVVDESQNREARHGQFRCRNSTGTFIFGCERRVTPYESPTATLATGLGSPWGDFAQLACSPEADSYSPAVIGLTAANAAIALLVVLWLVGRARPLIRRALVHYAQRVAPEYSYNLHEVAMASELSNPGNGHRKPGEREDGEEQQDTSEGDERILRALSAKLHGSFLDEFTPLQVIDFLLPGSTPVRCDKELPFALGSTLIHSLSGLVFHPIIYFGCYLYGCHQGVRQFPEETTQICGAESGSLNIWALVFALVAAFQGVAWTAWCIVYYVNAPLATRRPFRILAYVTWTLVALIGCIYVLVGVLWLLFTLLVFPERSISLLCLIASIVAYVVVIVLGLLGVLRASYDRRGRLKRVLVERGVVPETAVLWVGVQGVLLLACIIGWLAAIFLVLDSSGDFGNLIISVVTTIIGLVQSITGVNRTLNDIRKPFDQLRERIDGLETPLLEGEEEETVTANKSVALPKPPSLPNPPSNGQPAGVHEA